MPHHELMESAARRVSDCATLALIKAWFQMEVEEEVGHGGKRRTAATRNSGKKLWSSGLYDNDSGAVAKDFGSRTTAYHLGCIVPNPDNSIGSQFGSVTKHRIERLLTSL